MGKSGILKGDAEEWGESLGRTETDGMEQNKKNLPWVTVGLVTVNAIVFLLADLVFFREQGKFMYYLAMNPVLVTEHGEYWRLITSMFYHFDIEHVLFNMLSLYFVGAMLEPFFGKVRYTVLYFVSGLIANAVTILYYSWIAKEGASIVFSAGASGAVYGLIGAYAGVMVFFKDRLSKEEKIRLPLMILVLLFGNLSQEGVGHAAHFGGFFAGALIGVGYCMYLRKQQERRQ